VKPGNLQWIGRNASVDTSNMFLILVVCHSKVDEHSQTNSRCFQQPAATLSTCLVQPQISHLVPLLRFFSMNSFSPQTHSILSPKKRVPSWKSSPAMRKFGCFQASQSHFFMAMNRQVCSRLHILVYVFTVYINTNHIYRYTNDLIYKAYHENIRNFSAKFKKKRNHKEFCSHTTEIEHHFSRRDATLSMWRAFTASDTGEPTHGNPKRPKKEAFPIFDMNL